MRVETSRLRRRAGSSPILFLIAALGVGGFTAPAGADPLWTLSTESDVLFQRLTPLGTLLVSTENELSAIDPTTGQSLWKRSDIKKLKECNYDEMANTPFGLLDFGEGMGGMQRRIEVVDLQTGQTKWDSHELPFKSSQGLFQAPQKNLLLLVGTPEKGKKTTLIATDIETGALKWQQEALFSKPLQLFEVRGSGKVFKRYSVEGNQVPVYDTDDTAILWLSEDGPLKIDLASGSKLWVCDKLKGKAPPAFRNGYASMIAGEGLVFVPFEKNLQAVDAGSGALAWAKERGFKSRVAQMQLTSEGLVVRGAPALDEKGKMDGKPFIDLLDPKTGQSKWKKPFKDLEDATTFEVREGKLYIAADGELFAIQLADGSSQSVTKFKFKGGEVPSALETTEGGYLLSSSQNLMMIGSDGSVKFHTFYSAPGSSRFAKFASTALIMAANVGSASMAYNNSMATGQSQKYTLITGNPTLSRRFKATQSGSGYSSMLTNLEAEGRKGPGLVKVEKASGKETAKVVLGDKTPEYEMDPVEGRVFFLKSEREVLCYRF